ncbi:hypothetical protein T06_1398 [Trichinella sp. T6]|nr:hypothetical protein T06_1398 [Trichinella sp. T6]
MCVEVKLNDFKGQAAKGAGFNLSSPILASIAALSVEQIVFVFCCKNHEPRYNWKRSFIWKFISTLGIPQ